jgi:hypothetical protein
MKQEKNKKSFKNVLTSKRSYGIISKSLG